jgi:hypothetical protein
LAPAGYALLCYFDFDFGDQLRLDTLTGMSDFQSMSRGDYLWVFLLKGEPSLSNQTVQLLNVARSLHPMVYALRTGEQVFRPGSVSTTPAFAPPTMDTLRTCAASFVRQVDLLRAANEMIISILSRLSACVFNLFPVTSNLRFLQGTKINEINSPEHLLLPSNRFADHSVFSAYGDYAPSPPTNANLSICTASWFPPTLVINR